jgi:hypothetical protein
VTDFALEYYFEIDLICLFFKLLNHTRVSFSQKLALHYSLAYTRFGYLDGYCCSLIGVSICWAAAEADTQYTIFDLSALKK